MEDVVQRSTGMGEQVLDANPTAIKKITCSQREMLDKGDFRGSKGKK